jgi:hypothetical protein
MTFPEKVLHLIIIAIIGVVVGLLIAKSMDQQDKIDCYQWASEAKTLSDFYITPNEKAQCDHWHIEVNAQIK